MLSLMPCFQALDVVKQMLNFGSVRRRHIDQFSSFRLHLLEPIQEIWGAYLIFKCKQLLVRFVQSTIETPGVDSRKNLGERKYYREER